MSNDKKTYEKPFVSIFATCDQVIQDHFSRKMSLIGIFDRYSFPEFPAQANFMVFATLINGRGKIPVEFHWTGSGVTLALGHGEFEFNDPLSSLPVFFPARVLIERPGGFSVELVVGREVIATRRIEVVQTPIELTQRPIV